MIYNYIVLKLKLKAVTPFVPVAPKAAVSSYSLFIKDYTARNKDSLPTTGKDRMIAVAEAWKKLSSEEKGVGYSDSNLKPFEELANKTRESRRKDVAAFKSSMDLRTVVFVKKGLSTFVNSQPPTIARSWECRNYLLF